jgi:hypothetical protein
MCCTDPYCPPVWTMPSDDAPFIIESCNELPARRGMAMGMILRDTMMENRSCVGSHENAIHDMPELYHRHWHIQVQCPLELLVQGARTEILFEDGGILEIYHLDKETTEMRVRRGKRLLGQALPACTEGNFYLSHLFPGDKDCRESLVNK